MPITPAEFERRMKELSEKETTEWFHIQADKLMCEVLRQFGYDAGIDIFEGTGRWYS